MSLLDQRLSDFGNSTISDELDTIVTEARWRSKGKLGYYANEEYAMRHEFNDANSKKYRWDKQAEWQGRENEEARIGRIITHADLINKLRIECNLSCWYGQHPQNQKITLLASRNGYRAPEAVTWVQHGYMTEYSVMRFNEYGVPQDERFRGWRTVLLQLILKGFLTEATANRVFGEAYGSASGRYLRTLQTLRNAGMGC